jgi:hypothetical protein
MPKRSSKKPPADINQLAKYVVDRSTAEPVPPADEAAKKRRATPKKGAARRKKDRPS